MEQHQVVSVLSPKRLFGSSPASLSVQSPSWAWGLKAGLAQGRGPAGPQETGPSPRAEHQGGLKRELHSKPSLRGRYHPTRRMTSTGHGTSSRPCGAAGPRSPERGKLVTAGQGRGTQEDPHSSAPAPGLRGALPVSHNHTLCPCSCHTPARLTSLPRCPSSRRQCLHPSSVPSAQRRGRHTEVAQEASVLELRCRGRGSPWGRTTVSVHVTPASCQPPRSPQPSAGLGAGRR